MLPSLFIIAVSGIKIPLLKRGGRGVGQLKGSSCSASFHKEKKENSTLKFSSLPDPHIEILTLRSTYEDYSNRKNAL